MAFLSMPSSADARAMTVPSVAAVTFYRFPEPVRPNGWRRGGAVLAVAGLHLVGLLLAFGMVSRPAAPQPLPALEVRVIGAAPAVPTTPPSSPRMSATPPVPTPATKRPVAPKPPVARTVPPMPARPIAKAVSTPAATPSPTARPSDERLMAATETPSAAPAATTVPAAAPAVTAVPTVWQPARFDAAYLHNPQPPYPEMARRLGQQGRVVLRVRVNAQGTPLAIDVHRSSGFSRLDDAARAAVEHWRFVPARRGNDAVESSVLVPIQFDLRTDGDQ